MTSASSQLSKTLRRMLVRTQALVEAGVIEQPRWLDAVTRYPPEPLVKGHRPKKLRFPEDPLVQSYMTRHPEAKLTPIHLNGDQPAPARVFAARQLQLMQGGMSKLAARDHVEAEMEAERGAVNEGDDEGSHGEGSQLAAAQQAEEDVLQGAMAELTSDTPRIRRSSGLPR